ncbi:MAG: H-NS family nucleoid-associated regulatory protein [Hyphomicrobium sp.]
MVAVKVEKLSLQQINILEAKIGAAKLKARNKAKADIKAKIDALLKGSGFTILDIYPNAARGRGRGKLSAKYANPDNSAETWTGRGRRPYWLVGKLKKGKKLKDFLI